MLTVSRGGCDGIFDRDVLGCCSDMCLHKARLAMVLESNADIGKSVEVWPKE